METGRQQDLVAFASPFVVQSLHPHYTYHFRVGAHTVQTGPYSDVVVVQTPEDSKCKVHVLLIMRESIYWELVAMSFSIPLVPSGFPQSFMETVQSSSSVTLSWMPPLLDEQNGVLTGYTLNITETGSGVTTQRTLPSSQTSITVTSLLPFTTYSYAISASTSVGPGPFNTLLTVTTPEDGKD